MSFDQDLKQAFERHAGDVSPTPGTWTGVERRIRRSHRVRAALATAGGAAAVIAAVVVVPGILRNETPPAPLPATRPPSGSQDTSVFRSERDGYWLEYPKDWRFGEFEAHIDFQPPGVPSIVEGGSTFAVELWVDQGAYDEPDRLGTLEGGGQDVRDTTVAGRPAKVRRYDQRDGSKVARSDTYFVDWTGAYCPPGAPCPVPGPSVLIINIQATPSEEPLWDRYGEAGVQMVESIRVNSWSTMPPATDVTTRRGKVESETPYDATTRSVVRFMDARIEAGGAEPWLTANAKQQYDRHEGGLSLYSPNERSSFTGYRILRREAVDANSFEYTVEISVIITNQNQPETRSTFTETLGVGPGSAVEGPSPRTDPVIRFAQRSEAGPCFSNCPASSPA